MGGGGGGGGEGGEIFYSNGPTYMTITAPCAYMVETSKTRLHA